MTKKPIIPALTMLLTLVVLVHAAVLLVQQETAWWLVMDAACGVISLGMGAMWLICRKRGGTKNCMENVTWTDYRADADDSCAAICPD